MHGAVGREGETTYGVISCINFNFKSPESSSHRAKSIDNLRLGITIRKDKHSFRSIFTNVLKQFHHFVQIIQIVFIYKWHVKKLTCHFLLLTSRFNMIVMIIQES